MGEQGTGESFSREKDQSREYSAENQTADNDETNLSEIDESQDEFSRTLSSEEEVFVSDDPEDSDFSVVLEKSLAKPRPKTSGEFKFSLDPSDLDSSVVSEDSPIVKSKFRRAKPPISSDESMSE